MSIPSDKRDPELASFDQWLRKCAVQPRPDFWIRLRQRLHEEADPVEAALDKGFLMDPRLRDPEMARKVRQRLLAESGQSRRPRIDWFSVAAPLAAAATLALAFVSFQTRAPGPVTDRIPQPFEAAAGNSAYMDREEVTRILALAANLSSTADMTQLQSVEDLAFLFD